MWFCVGFDRDRTATTAHILDKEPSPVLKESVSLPEVLLSVRAESKQRHDRGGGRFRISPPSPEPLPSFKRPKGSALLDIPVQTGSPAGKPLAGVHWSCHVGKIPVYPGRAEALPGCVVLKRFVLLESAQGERSSLRTKNRPPALQCFGRPYLTFLPSGLCEVVKSYCFFRNTDLTRVGNINNNDFTNLKVAIAVTIEVFS